jgi:hypothetical protein
MSRDSDTLSRLRANQSLLFIIKAACAYFHNLWFDTIEPTICRTRSEHPNHYTMHRWKTQMLQDIINIILTVILNTSLFGYNYLILHSQLHLSII